MQYTDEGVEECVHSQLMAACQTAAIGNSRDESSGPMGFNDSHVKCTSSILWGMQNT